MKNTLSYNLKQSYKYSKFQIQSLKILSMSVNNLEEYIESISENNPLIEFDFSINNYVELNDSILISEDISLSKHLLNQLKYVQHTFLCELLIYELNSNGYFKKTYDELIINYNTNNSQLDKAIKILQTLEPIGIACFTLKESLLNQIMYSNYNEKDKSILLLDYLDDIAKNNIKSISIKTNLSINDIYKQITFIKTLNPKPAANFSSNSQQLTPDIIIETQNEINIKIHNINERIKYIEDYKENKELKYFYNLNKKIKEQINLRNKTLAIIINAIIELQYDYFIFNKQLKPMKFKDISNITNLSISTISRTVNNKLISLNNKYILLKNLFSNEINNQSSIAIKEKIKKIIEFEETPLSDQDIVNILTLEDIKISRRTVNKYRKQLNINSSYIRNFKY